MTVIEVHDLRIEFIRDKGKEPKTINANPMDLKEFNYLTVKTIAGLKVVTNDNILKGEYYVL